MKTTRCRNGFARMTNERYEPDTDITCSICGNGIFSGEAVAWDKNEEICHAECVKEDDLWNKRN